MKDQTPENQRANAKKLRPDCGRVRRRAGMPTAKAGRRRSRWLIPDDVADTIVAEMRELENVAHE